MIESCNKTKLQNQKFVFLHTNPDENLYYTPFPQLNILNTFFLLEKLIFVCPSILIGSKYYYFSPIHLTFYVY